MQKVVQESLLSLHKFILNSLQDWVCWGNKLKWLFISFKVVSFFGFSGLLVALWFGLEKAFQKSVEVAVGLHSAGYIDKGQIVEIVNTSQTLLYDKVVGHVSVVAVGVLVSIVGLKIMSEKVESDIIKKGKDLGKYLPAGSSDNAKKK